jgi:gliding motility-associated-like protein
MAFSSFIPNVITPNNDAYNDHFMVDEGLQGLISLQIFNRWGRSVFHADHYQNDWDGAGLPPGVYFYRLTGACIDEKKGAVSILR